MAVSSKKKKKSFWDRLGGEISKGNPFSAANNGGQKASMNPFTGMNPLSAQNNGGKSLPVGKFLSQGNPLSAQNRKDFGTVFDPNKGGVSPGTQLFGALSPFGAALSHAKYGDQKIGAPAGQYSSDMDAQRRSAFGAPSSGQQVADASITGEPDAEWFNKTLGDYLASSTSSANQGIAAQLAALEAARGTGQQSAAAGDAKLAAMYQALQNQVAKQTAETAGRYKQAGADSAALTAQNQAALSGANKAAQSQQDQTLANLGIAGSTNRPGGAAGVQTEAASIGNSQNQQFGNTAGQAIIAGGLTQQNFGNQMGTAAQFAGANRRADLQTALMKYLGDIGMQEAQLRDSAASSASSNARADRNADYQMWLDQRNWETGREDKNYQRQQDALGGGVDPSSLKGQDKALYDLQSAGVDDISQRAIMNIIASGANSAGTNPSTGVKISPWQGAYRAIDAAIAAKQLPENLRGAALAAATSAIGSY